MGILSDYMSSAIEKVLDYVDKNKTGWINVRAYGIDNKGIEDCSEKVQTLLDSLPLASVLYFPQGKYLFKSGVIINKSMSIIGDGGINMISDANVAVNGTVFLFDDEVSNDTLITLGVKAYNVDIKNIGFHANSATFTAKDYDERPSEPCNPYEFSIIKENVNGFDATNGVRTHFYSCAFEGFSGYGIRSSMTNRFNDCRFNVCGNAMEIFGNDCILQNCRISASKNGIYTGTSARSMFAYDLWIDLIEGYGLYGEQLGGIVTGIIDHIGYSAFAFTRLMSLFAQMRINRCGMYYANAISSELGNDNDKDAWLSELKKYALVCADYINASTLTISAYYRTLDDDCMSAYYSPNCIIATYLSSDTTVTIPNIEKENKNGVNIIAINSSSEMNIIYPDGVTFLRKLKNFCMSPTILTRTSKPIGATPSKKIGDLVYDNKNHKLYIAQEIDGTNTTWGVLNPSADGNSIVETEGVLSVSESLLARIAELEAKIAELTATTTE